MEILQLLYSRRCPFANTTDSLSKSKLLCEWRFTANQFVLASGPLRPTTRNFFQLNSCGNSPYVTSSLTRDGSVVYNCCWSESRGTHDHILLSQIRDSPKLESLRIYIHQEGGPVITLGTGFPFRRLLLLAELRWKYSTLPSQGTSQSQSYVTTDGQSASLSWNKAPIWGLRPDLYYCQIVEGLLM
jgi:hypothetical protein